MRIRRALGRTGAMGSTVIALLGVILVPQASAAETCVSTTGAKMCWQSTGDDVYITDTKADGHRAGGYYATDRGSYGWCENTKGANTTVKCNLELEEPDMIDFYAARCEGPCAPFGSTALNKSGWKRVAV